jgi:hypothetical protein
MVWLTFNVPTLAFLIPYFAARKNKKTQAYLQKAMEKNEVEDSAVDEETNS